jgi:Rrf2 family protein
MSMMSLSQTSGYAIRALSCLASCDDTPAFIQDIAEVAEVPQAYLAKIVKKLNDAGVIESKRGYRGGIWLSRPPKEINLLEISEILDGKDFLSSCLLGSEFCSDQRDCPTHRFWKKTRAAIRQELANTSLADVVAFYRRRGLYQYAAR